MLNEKEKSLIVALRNNSRQKINVLAKKHSYPVSTMIDMLHKMEREGIVFHNSSLCFTKIGYPLQLFMAVKTDNSGREELKSFLSNQKNVNSFYLVNSGYDYHFEAIFKNSKEEYDFIDELNRKNKILDSHIYRVIESIHNNRFLSREDHFE